MLMLNGCDCRLFFTMLSRFFLIRALPNLVCSFNSINVRLVGGDDEKDEAAALVALQAGRRDRLRWPRSRLGRASELSMIFMAQSVHCIRANDHELASYNVYRAAIIDLLDYIDQVLILRTGLCEADWRGSQPDGQTLLDGQRELVDSALTFRFLRFLPRVDPRIPT